MRVLRLGHSTDVVGDIPPELRSSAIAERTLAAACGEPVETIVRPLWPAPGLPDLIASWLDRYEPAIVSLKVSSYWVAYPSVPLKLQRSDSWAARRVATLGFRAADTAWLSWNGAFRAVRRRAIKTVGGAYYFEPDAIADLMETCIRRILRVENVVLGVIGPSPLFPPGSPGAAESEARRARLRESVADICGELRVPFMPFEADPAGAYFRDLQGMDGIHSGIVGHGIQGEAEGELLIAAWKQMATRR